MRKIVLVIISVSISMFVYGHKTTCISDSFMLGFLNSQNSYSFSTNGFILNNVYAGGQAEYSFSEPCLSSAARTRLMSLLKGEPYDFKEELEKYRKKILDPNSSWAKYEAKWTLKGDTVRLAERLDSLYKPKEAEELKWLQAKKYSNEILLFVGQIYFYEAMPYLKAGLTDSSYLKRYDKERTQQTLARLGDKYWIKYYTKKFSKPSKDFQECMYNLEYANYINDGSVFKTVYETELKNKNVGTSNYSDYSISKPMWQWTLGDLISVSTGLKELQKEKFGKSLYELADSGVDIYTEEYRKGMLEILRKCKYDCLVDYSQKERK